jgi:hypothetical protein
VKAYSKGPNGVADPLLDLLGKSESAAVALLGPPKTRESLWDIDNTDLVWSFPVAGRPISGLTPKAYRPLRSISKQAWAASRLVLFGERKRETA